MAIQIVFASSFFLVSALVVFKAIELKYGRKNIILGLINRFDSDSKKLVAFLKFKSLQLIQSVRYIVLIEIREMAKHLFFKTQEKILDEYKKRQDTIITGKKEIINKGSVSFYLKKITEDKSNGQKGKIEDVL